MKRCSNRTGILTALLVLCGLYSTSQQKIVSSCELELDYAFGGGAYGLLAKANHQWTNKDVLNVQSGISTDFFIESNGLSTYTYKRTGILFDPNLNAYTGVHLSLLKRKIGLQLDLFGGVYMIRRQGKYSSSSLVFVQDKYRHQKTYFNGGTRLTLAYNLNERMGLHLSANHSWVDWMLFSGTDYSKMFFGAGVMYHFRKPEK
jgi:hypothetical protein